MGWIEITQDNVNELYELRDKGIPFMISYIDCDGNISYSDVKSMYLSLNTMAKYGGYYYFVLPHLTSTHHIMMKTHNNY